MALCDGWRRASPLPTRSRLLETLLAEMLAAAEMLEPVAAVQAENAVA